MAKVVQGSKHAVWRILRQEGISLQRRRSWYVSTDKEFSAKAADIVGLYLDPQDKALVICVDEKLGIQALERASGYVQTSNGKIIRGGAKHISPSWRLESVCCASGGNRADLFKHHPI